MRNNYNSCFSKTAALLNSNQSRVALKDFDKYLIYIHLRLAKVVATSENTYCKNN